MNNSLYYITKLGARLRALETSNIFYVILVHAFQGWNEEVQLLHSTRAI